MADGFSSGVVPETGDDHARRSEGLRDRSAVEADGTYGEGGPGREPEPRTETVEVARPTGTERMSGHEDDRLRPGCYHRGSVGTSG